MQIVCYIMAIKMILIHGYYYHVIRRLILETVVNKSLSQSISSSFTYAAVSPILRLLALNQFNISNDHW